MERTYVFTLLLHRKYAAAPKKILRAPALAKSPKFIADILKHYLESYGDFRLKYDGRKEGATVYKTNSDKRGRYFTLTIIRRTSKRTGYE